MSEWQVQYWDSTLFITLVEGRETERISVIRSLLHSYEQKKLQIAVSTFAIAECRRYRQLDTPGPAPGDEGTAATTPLNDDNGKVVREVFASPQLLVWTLTPHIAELAADIGNQYPDLLPGDCVHIATAIEANADVLFTYDGAGKGRRRPDAMIRYDGKIGNPPLPIKEPWDIWPTIWSARDADEST